METIRKGYKQTDIGVIPEEWTDKKMLEIGDTYTGLTGKNAADFKRGEARYIPFLNILTNPQIDIRFLESVSVKPTEIQNRVKNGDLFFNTSSETPEEVGLCSVLQQDIPNLYLNSFCFGFRLFNQKEVNGLFLSYFFRSKRGRCLMIQLAQGATRYNLAKTNFMQAIIPLPSPDEQRAIAAVLSDIDSLIEVLDKKIAKKRAIKDGAMQQLLTAKKRLPRFSDPWVEKKLGDIVSMNSGGTPLSTNPLYYNGDISFLSISDISASGRYITNTEKSITSLGLQNSSARIFPSGTLMYAMYATLGKCAITKIDLSCSQAILGITPNKNSLDINLLYYLLCFKEDEVSELGQTGTQSNLSKTIVQDFDIIYPANHLEQQAIVQILTDMDDEIEKLEQQRSKYTALKQGAMQQLLTGQIRLVADRQIRQSD